MQLGVHKKYLEVLNGLSGIQNKSLGVHNMSLGVYNKALEYQKSPKSI